MAPPRPTIWVLLLASAVTVLLTGIVATVVLAAAVVDASAVIARPQFWLALLVGAGLTVLSLALRALRWIFLLRRAETRIPIRDAYIGYFAGFSLLLAPLLLGEIAVRAYINGVRGGVGTATTALVNLWERLCDVIALAIVAAVALVLVGGRGPLIAGLLGGAALYFLPPVRRSVLRVLRGMVTSIPGLTLPGDAKGLVSMRAWLVSIVASIAAWVLPGLCLWVVAQAFGAALTIRHAQAAYALASLSGGLTLAPGGVLVTGRRLLDELSDAGFAESDAVLTVITVRLATVGVSTVLGVVMLVAHLAERRPAAAAAHFDAIADAYDAQIPAARREALVTRKTEIMRDVLVAHDLHPATGVRGLDVGCGQGWYVARMRQLGYDVTGIDASPGQVRLAAEGLGDPALVSVGSVDRLPAPDGSLDFVYTINVLHHLPSLDAQRAAFAELARVLRPGGLLFVHEINTRNLLFRFYMGYVFPSLNCIDEGIERWLLPHRLDRYTDLPVIDIRYFTFLPDFLPQRLVQALAPVERRLERSAAAPYSAHYMAVVRKPA